MQLPAVVDEPSLAGYLNATLLMSSLGSWSFPRSRAPHDDVRVGRLNVCNGVRRTAASRMNEVVTTTVPAGHRRPRRLGREPLVTIM